MRRKKSAHLTTNKRLILLVKARPAIWDEQHLDHNVTETRNGLFAEILAEMNTGNVFFKSGKIPFIK